MQNNLHSAVCTCRVTYNIYVVPFYNCLQISFQKRLETVLAEKPEETQQQNGAPGASFNRDTYLREVEQFDDVEIVVAGTNNSVRIDRKNERAEKLFLHYIQRWAKDYLRRRLDWVVEDMYGRRYYLFLYTMTFHAPKCKATIFLSVTMLPTQILVI